MIDHSPEATRARLDAAQGLLEMVRTSAAADGSRAALIFHQPPFDRPPRVVTYGELLDQCMSLAGALEALGLAAGDTVALLSPATPETLSMLIAASAVATVFPINLLLSPDALASQLRLSKARAAVILRDAKLDGPNAQFEAAFRQCPDLRHVIEIEGEPAKRGAAAGRKGRLRWRELTAHPPARPRPSAGAALFHTGGTTGSPKLARLSARNLAAGAYMSAAALQLASSDRLLLGLPLFHVGGAITSAAAALSAGATVIFCGYFGARDPAVVRDVWRLIDDLAATVLVMVPTSLGAMIEVPRDGAGLATLRAVMTGSTALSPDLAARLERELGVPVCQVFGMTELSGICTAQPLDGQFRAPAVGYPAPLLRLAIAGPAGPGVPGEVMLNGPNRFSGYLTRDGLVAEPAEEPVATGDLGELLPDGQLRLMGRHKDVIIRGGHNIDPLTIEDVAYAHPAVAQAAAVAMPDGYAGEVPVLYVALRPGAAAEALEIGDHVAARIAEPPARPRAVFILPELPLTPIGKIARYRLRQEAARRAAAEALAGLPAAGVDCADIAAKRIEVAWEPAAAPAVREEARRRLSALGLRLAEDADQ